MGLDKDCLTLWKSEKLTHMKAALALIGLCILAESYSLASAQVYGNRGRAGRFTGSGRFQPLPEKSPGVIIAPATEERTSREFRKVNEPLPTFLYQGTRYKDAILEKASDTEGFVRIEPGLVRVKLADLEEPARSKFYKPPPAGKPEAAIPQRIGPTPEVLAAQAALAEKVEIEGAVQGKDPIREFDGQLYDFTNLLLHRERLYKKGRNHKSYQTEREGLMVLAEMKEILAELQATTQYFISGKVMSVHGEGILIRTNEKDGPFEIVFLKNYPKAATLFDGSPLNRCAFFAGRYQYQSTTGSQKTIPLYDYGKPSSGRGFSTVRKIDASGTQFTDEFFAQSKP